MSSHPGVSDTALPPGPQAPQVMSVGWALRRTALWLVMMTVMVAVGVWLFNASIDPDEATASPFTPGQTTQTAK